VEKFPFRMFDGAGTISLPIAQLAIFLWFPTRMVCIHPFRGFCGKWWPGARVCGNNYYFIIMLLFLCRRCANDEPVECTHAWCVGKTSSGCFHGLGGLSSQDAMFVVMSCLSVKSCFI